MSRIGQSGSPVLTQMERKVLVAADRAGDADGITSQQEMAAMAETLESQVLPTFDLQATERKQAAAGLLGKVDEAGIETLAPELRALPTQLQRLALEVDSLWGNTDGELSVEEVDRVAKYYLSALPFFMEDASMLMELATHLGWAEALPSEGETGAKASSVVALQIALSKVDQAELEEAASLKPFRALFDEAIKDAEVPGAPELLRDAATHSPRWHRLSILEHTASTVRAAHALSEAVDRDWKDVGATMLLHDVGKILERKVRDEPSHSAFHFYDHEAIGARWLEERGIPDEMKFQIHNHCVLRKKSVDEMVALSGGDPQRLGNMVMVYVSDQLGKGDTPDQLESFDQQRDKIKTLAKMAGIDGERLLATADQLRNEWYPYY